MKASYHRAFKCCINLIFKYIHQGWHMQQSVIIHAIILYIPWKRLSMFVMNEGMKRTLNNVTIFKSCCRGMQNVTMCVWWAYNIPLCLSPSSITADCYLMAGFSVSTHTIKIQNITCYKCLSLNTWIQKNNILSKFMHPY